MAALYRASDQMNGDFWPTLENFDTFYDQQHDLLNRDAWKEYYSPAFLKQPTSARFYRLPNLRDLPDASDPLAGPRPQKGYGHFTEIPRWAHSVVRTQRNQPTLPKETITQIALSTLQQTTSRLRKGNHPKGQLYSETQTWFWLRKMGIDSPSRSPKESAGGPDQFGADIGRGDIDMCRWEAYYSPKLWNSMEARTVVLEPDLDGTRPSEFWGCGWPDGGTTLYVWQRGWDPEVGSEEEIEFMAAVAAKETEGVDVDLGNLDYSIRSQVLLAVMRAAFETATERREKEIEDLKQRIVEMGRIKDESKAEQWVREVLKVMAPYAQKRDQDGWPAAVEDRGELLRRILLENGQLFARWRHPRRSKEYHFEPEAAEPW